MDRATATRHFFRAANADPARMLQQTVCYDRAGSCTITVSVAWDYSVQVFPGTVLLPDLLAVQRTFAPWKRDRNVTDAYLFDSKRYPRDECRRATLFFLQSVSLGDGGRTKTVCTRQAPSRKCSDDESMVSPLRNLRLIEVASEQLHLVPDKALRRQWCDVVFSWSDNNTTGVRIRKCRDDELIANALVVTICLVTID